MVLEVLLSIGNEADWPKQTRPNVTDSGRPVPGMCLGLVFGLGGGGAKASLISEKYPDLAGLVVRWCCASLPKTRDGNKFPFSSLQINYNYAAKVNYANLKRKRVSDVNIDLHSPRNTSTAITSALAT